MDSQPYELLDCGAGRKLERFGPWILDRPAPQAQNESKRPSWWTRADARYDRRSAQQGKWTLQSEVPDQWNVPFGSKVMQVRRTASGAVGIFPEQMCNWHWLERELKKRRPGMRVLNLFGYTGGSTLAAAVGGAEVVHVDAAQSVVQWARQSARTSHLGDATIRWIVDDARKFVEREVRRGHRYDCLVLDPPSYGHGPRGHAWKIRKHLEPLLVTCANVTGHSAQIVLFTCHTLGYDPDVLARLLIKTGCLPEDPEWRPFVETARLTLNAESGATLACGGVARWARPMKT